MIPFAFASAQALTGGLGAAYLAGGLVVAGLLERRGHPRGAVLGAVVAWPLLLPLVGEAPRSPTPRGPLRPRIDQALAALVETLGDPAATEVRWTADLDGLRHALYGADARLALVDRLLAGDAPGAEEATATLRAARAESEAAVQAVLAEVQQLRIQVGLAALAGGGEALTEKLRELSARAGALAEVGTG